MRNDGSGAPCIVVIGREILTAPFPGLSATLAVFRGVLDQFNIVLEAIMLGDE